MSMPEYLDRLSRSARGESVSSMRTVPVVHRSGKSATEEYLVFTTWAHPFRRLRSIMFHRASVKEADVSLERTLRLNIAKFTGQRPSKAILLQ